MIPRRRPDKCFRWMDVDGYRRNKIETLETKVKLASDPAVITKLRLQIEQQRQALERNRR